MMPIADQCAAVVQYDWLKKLHSRPKQLLLVNVDFLFFSQLSVASSGRGNGATAHPKF